MLIFTYFLICSALAWVELKGIWNGSSSGPFQMEATKGNYLYLGGLYFKDGMTSTQ